MEDDEKDLKDIINMLQQTISLVKESTLEDDEKDFKDIINMLNPSPTAMATQFLMLVWSCSEKNAVIVKSMQAFLKQAVSRLLHVILPAQQIVVNVEIDSVELGVETLKLHKRRRQT